MPRRQPFTTQKRNELREIGWKNWDPIGLINDRVHCEDEYDTYLLVAVGMCKKGASLEEVQNYLASIENVHMGLGQPPDVEVRTSNAAEAIMKFASTF